MVRAGVEKGGPLPQSIVMNSNFALLGKHLENDVRRQQLLNIERRLR
jgi:hypothetical protein